MDSSLPLVKGVDDVWLRGVPLQSYIRPLFVELLRLRAIMEDSLGRAATHCTVLSRDALVIGFCPAADGPLSP
jgi:hypothetical protein